MSDDRESRVAERMEAARQLARGVMRLNIIMSDPEDRQIAEAWMKGKRNVKNLSVVSESVWARHYR